MIDLYLIRHAESETNLRPDLVGGRELGACLTPRGREQARQLGTFLRGVRFDTVFTSACTRAEETARIACDIAGFQGSIQSSEALLEISHGDWEGKPKAIVRTPRVLKELNSNNWHYRPPNGESHWEGEERFSFWVEHELLDSHEDHTVAVFTHGIIMSCFLRRVLDSAPYMNHRLVINNASITHLQHDAGGWRLVTFNSTAHLQSRADSSWDAITGKINKEGIDPEQYERA